jgi:rare lipoprotein A (peptidoglycan hydrolase)
VSCEYQEHHVRLFRSAARTHGLLPTICFVVAIAMFGCSTQPAPQTQYTPPPPSPAPRRGRLEVASWYGPGFVGHATSDGEIYNPRELTAASKTLPIGSHVRVTNPENGRSVVVRVNDRGPYVRGRSLDLSRSAARRIGMIGKGVCRVRVRVLRATSHDDRTYGQTRGRTSEASNAGSLPYIRRTLYHESQRRSSKRRRASQPPG